MQILWEPAGRPLKMSQKSVLAPSLGEGTPMGSELARPPAARRPQALCDCHTGPWALVPWSRALGSGPLVPGPGPWSPGPGPWALVPGPWSLGPGPWSNGSRALVQWSRALRPGPMVLGPWSNGPWPWAQGPPGCSHIGIILTLGQPYRDYSYPGPAIP